MNDTKDFSWEVVKNLGNFSEGRENYSKTVLRKQVPLRSQKPEIP